MNSRFPTETSSPCCSQNERRNRVLGIARMEVSFFKLQFSHIYKLSSFSIKVLVVVFLD